MAGSTGTAERWKIDKNLSSITSSTFPQKITQRVGSKQGSPCSFSRANVTLSGVSRDSGKLAHTSDPFGPCAMTLLLGVHLHLGIDKQAVSVSICMQRPVGHELNTAVLVKGF